LVAGLSVVDFVVPSEQGDLEALMAELDGGNVIRGEEADAALAQELIEHVHKRQRSL
jgi:hypothetical protein